MCCPDVSFADVSDVSAIAKTDGEFIAKLPFKWARCTNSQSIWVDNPYAKPVHQYFEPEHNPYAKNPYAKNPYAKNPYSKPTVQSQWDAHQSPVF